MNNTNYGINFMAGPLSGIIEVCIGHPIDRIKTELQILTLTKHNSTIKCALNSIYHNKNIGNFYSGIIPRLIGIVPMRLTYWGTMGTMNDLVIDQNKYIKYIVPGVITGFVQTLIDAPIEMIKVRLMSGGNNKKFPIVLPSELYNGFSVCVMRNMIFAVPVAIATKTFGHDNPLISGAVGGIIGSVMSQPFDVIKTEIQRYNHDKSKTGIDIFNDIYKTNKKKLWSGGLMRCMQGGINMGVGFFAVQYICKILSCSTYFD